MKMYVDRVLAPVTTMGPGRRLAVWVAGCSRHCWNCANPELWTRKAQQEMHANKVAGLLLEIAAQQGLSDLTITGGEPFEQYEDLLRLLESIRIAFSDILIYTGYQRSELHRMLTIDYRMRFAQVIDVLVDGPYIDQLNFPNVVMRGSENQTVHILNSALANKYEAYMKQPRGVQNFITPSGVVSVGIHNRFVEAQYGA